MSPATAPPERRDQVRMLVVDRDADIASADITSARDARFADIIDYLQPGDALVVNDAATLPASLSGQLVDGRPVELRLVGPGESDDARWRAVLMGAGDWHQATEERPAPPLLSVGHDIYIADSGASSASNASLQARVVGHDPVSPRLLLIEFNRRGADLWAALYAAGRPVQYSYLDDDLDLWSVQTVYSGRPWAVEMPSAGRPLTWSLLRALRQRGVTVVALTHAAGLSATGDPAIDRALPLPERYDIPAATVDAIRAVKRAGGRIIAVGTSVVRALEGCVAEHGQLQAGEGVTDLIIDADLQPVVVAGLLTGVHAPTESHFRLLRAFAGEASLQSAWADSARLGYRYHEFGDTWLIGAGLAR